MHGQLILPILALGFLGLLPAMAAEPGEVPGSLPILPEGGGILNVRDAAYGAVGDGVADDTAAIQKALSEALDSHRIVYLPKGTYLVSNTLRWWREGYNIDHVNGWGGFMQLLGQSRSGTIIRLKDACPGFTDAAATRPVIATGSRGYHGNKGYKNGEGNEAFENHIRDLTVEIGSGNPGAVGIDYQVSNCGAMRNVTIRTRDAASGASGAIGIDLRRRDNGPGLIADVLVEGFAVGLRTGQELAQINLKDVRLKGQREAGIINQDAILLINGLISDNRVAAVVNRGVGNLTLVDARAEGGAPDAFALRNDGGDAVLLLRNLAIKGYQAALDLKPKPLTGPSVACWSSHPLIGGDAAAAGKAWLPSAETPRYALPDLSQWAWLPSPSGEDDTEAVQKALESGKPVLALGAGRWFISKPLKVPTSLRLIYGLGAEIDTKKGQWSADQPFLRLAGGKATDTLILDRFAFGGGDACPRLVEHEDTRTVVMRDLILFAGRAYRNQGGAKKLFLENVCADSYHFGPGTQVWADQFDAEGRDTIIEKAQVLIYGYKHEGHSTRFFQGSGSTVQLFGGLIYSFGGVAAEPGIDLQDCPGSLISLVNITYVGDGTYPLPLRTQSGAAVTEIRREQLPRRGGGYAIPLAVVK